MNPQQMRSYLNDLPFRYHSMDSVDDETVIRLYDYYKKLEEKHPKLISMVTGNSQKVIDDHHKLSRPRKKRLL